MVIISQALVTVKAQFESLTSVQGHFRSTYVFFLIPPHRNEIERCRWSHGVQTVKTCRLINKFLKMMIWVNMCYFLAKFQNNVTQLFWHFRFT